MEIDNEDAHSSQDDTTTPTTLPIPGPVLEETSQPCDDITKLHPTVLHLCPVDWRRFLKLSQPSFGYFDYVDGRVIWVRDMGDAAHVNLSKAYEVTAECYSKGTLIVYPQSAIKIKCPVSSTTMWTTDHNNATQAVRTSSSSSDPSSRSGPREYPYGLLHPDLLFARVREGSDEGSITSRDSQAKRSIQFPLPYSDTLLGVAEVTSGKTRKFDLNGKWKLFAHSGISEYIIHDRGTTTQTPRIIIGTLHEVAGSTPSISGDKDIRPSQRQTRQTTSQPFYYRREFRGSDIVDISFYRDSNLTVDQMFDENLMERFSRRAFRRRAEQEERANQEAARADQEATRADQEATRANQEVARARRYAERLRELGEELPLTPESGTSNM